MSAIVSIAYLDKRQLEQPTLMDMMQALSHHSADRRDVWFEGSVGLGSQMLWSTPKTQHEKFPFTNSLRDLVITADARLDNRDELFTLLNISHHDPTTPDSKLILYAYERWGSECPAHLLGDFAFVIWDIKNQQLFCARDHMGVKPFYYYYSPQLFVCASEIKAILHVPGVPNQFNEKCIADYLVANMDNKEQTFYEHIFRLPPGHNLIIKNGEKRLNSYWSLDPSKEIRLRSDEEYVERFQELFSQAMDCRMRTTLPVGSMLSGGLDSSAIACLAARKLQKTGQTLPTFSWVLPEGDDWPIKDDRSYIEAVLLAQENMEANYVLTSDQTILDNLEDSFQIHDGPCWIQGQHMFNKTHELAEQRGIRILLSGFGGNELSDRHQLYLSQLALQGRWLKLFKEARQTASLYQQSLHSVLMSNVVSRTFPSLFSSYLHLRGQQSHSKRLNSAIHPEFAKRMCVDEQEEQTYSFNSGGRARAYNYRMLSGGHIPLMMEVMAAAASRYQIEYRFPLLDKRIVEFFLAVPDEQHVRHGWKRYLFRRGMEGILPAKIQWRIDSGVPNPDQSRQMVRSRQQLLEAVRSIAQSKTMNEYISIDKLQREVESIPTSEAEFKSGKHSSTMHLVLLRAIFFGKFIQWLSTQSKEREVCEKQLSATTSFK
jgi:asparagine synthase (glutamine-hydrolysing)